MKLLVKLHALHRYTTHSHATLPARLERLNHEAKSQNHNWCSPSHSCQTRHVNIYCGCFWKGGKKEEFTERSQTQRWVSELLSLQQIALISEETVHLVTCSSNWWHFDLATGRLHTDDLINESLPVWCPLTWLSRAVTADLKNVWREKWMRG